MQALHFSIYQYLTSLITLTEYCHRFIGNIHKLCKHENSTLFKFKIISSSEVHILLKI